MNNFEKTNHVEKRKPKDINLKELFQVLKRRYWIILIVMLLSSAVGVIQNNSKPISLYQSSSDIFINANPELRKTLQVIVKNSTVLDKVVEELTLTKTAEALAEQISVSSIEETQVVRISVIDSDPSLAAKIADTTAEVFIEKVPMILGPDYTLRQLSKAKVSRIPINQPNNNKLFIALIGGLVVGIGLAFLVESLDDRIRSEHEIELLLGIPLLGKVSRVTRRSVKKKSSNWQIVIEQRGEDIGNN
ncbi:YveK family protein [Neobacillus drentensis]|uniref:YveK family protein n=1 Tax=Neobacillus drentensis TaxID=220684 RepID=UPI002FFFE60F